MRFLTTRPDVLHLDSRWQRRRCSSERTVGVTIGVPVCVGPAALMMKALGAARFFISRAVFLANPQLYFELLRTAGAAAA